ncbi:TfoX/Sxy family protein [Piscinibacter sp. XHJ-5]|uniref:TfoX/Sxy family protein n=1 Tax=Piscinibacter sp. XHJ-5 TaxID=3037797 RepID=UPI0024529FFF|nr:TfoX/Sxy family protein [Piscinibacter sp. XHJ-5]
MAYEELANHCVELFEPLGAARSRRMFGGHGVYIDDLFVALIADDRIYLKADVHTRPAFEAAGCEPFVYDGAGGQHVALGYWSAPAEAMDSAAQMQPWARLAIEAALRARAAKPPAARRKPPARRSAADATPRKPKAAASRGKARTGRG